MGKITVETSVHADIAKTWSYWNEPQHITQWAFASGDWECSRAENDLKVGGTFSSRMQAKDGSAGFDFKGVYSEVTEHKKISYTMDDGREVTTTFEQIGDTTKIVQLFDSEDENSIELQQQGWQSILESFKKHIEAN